MSQIAAYDVALQINATLRLGLRVQAPGPDAAFYNAMRIARSDPRFATMTPFIVRGDPPILVEPPPRVANLRAV